MKVDRSKLEQKLNLIFDEFSLSKDIKNDVYDKLKHKKILKSDLLGIIAKSIPLQTLDKDMLYTITNAFYFVLNREIINPAKYFTENEIKEYKKFKVTKEELKKYPIKLERVIKFNGRHFSTKLSAKELNELYRRRVIHYNPDTQRPLKNGDVDLNQTSVNEISERILKGKQKSNYITLNLLEGSGEDFVYDENAMELTIYSGEIDIVDGFHRSMGIKDAISKNPNVEFSIGVNITNYDEDNVLDFIIQEDKRNEIDKRYLKSKDPENMANKVVEKLNDKSKCDLGDKITTDPYMIIRGDALTLTDIMSDSIDYHFDMDTRLEKDNVTDWLTDFFNFLIGTHKNEFLTNVKEVKEHSYINNKRIFIGYVALAKELYNDEDWKDKLLRTIREINFDKSNSDWEKEVNINSQHFNNSLIKRVSNYFIDKL